MLVIKKHGFRNLVFVPLAGWLLICGCTPPGPRALLKGEKLIREGKPEQAVEQLQKAVQLLPKNAQAWNFLGLAYQANKQNDQAIKAYKQALVLDHKLAPVRFNLGCAYLEENEVALAVEQLTSFTLVEPRSVDGQLKLGAAQLRARRVDLAEKAFRTVLEMQPNNPEALNGLGMLQLHRRRATEALGLFNQALEHSPNYGPALLNAAVLLQQSFNNRGAALQKYKQYLAIQPRPENWAAVSALASQLEAEMTPPPPTPVTPVMPPVVAVVPVTSPKPNPAVAAPKEVAPLKEVAARASPSNPLPPVVVAVMRSNPPVKTNAPKPSPVVAAIKTNVVAPVKTSAPPVVTQANVPNTPVPDLEVTRVTDEFVIKPPQEVAVAPRTESNVRTTQAPVVTSPKTTTAKPEKRGFLTRLNPFAGRNKTAPAPIVGTVQTNEVREINTIETAAPEVVTPAASLPRYTYLSPSAPAAGKRKEAEPFFFNGIKAQQAGHASKAVSEYQKAVQLDPSYYEAHYNQGLAAYQMGNWKVALTAFEHALAIKSDSPDARYNFGLTLKQANYLLDAAAEFTSLLRGRPNDTRAHYSLATLYSQKLNQPALARVHFEKVLENDPRHPKAAEIRNWLATHP